MFLPVFPSLNCASPIGRGVLILGVFLASGLSGIRAASPSEGSVASVGKGEGVSPYIEYQRGELPVIICAPHGGRERPEGIPDRTSGTFAFDTNTQELARSIAAAFKARSGSAVHLVVCKLQRVKLDCNREVLEGAAGQGEALVAWNAYHGSIRRAIDEALKRHGGVFLLDLHGHGHKMQRLEIGYGQGPEILGLSDTELNKAAVWGQSTLAALVKHGQASYADLLHGPLSFGTLMENAGFPSTPSGSVPVPPSPYFNGGFTVRSHFDAGKNVSALQIETNYSGVRDNAESRQKFGNALFDVLRVYLKAHQGLDISGTHVTGLP